MLASPGLPSFDYVKASSPQEVSQLLLQHNGQERPKKARLLMGGTDLLVRMRDGAISPQVVIDVKHLPGMRQIEFDPRAGLTIGAAVDMNTLARHPAVIEHYGLLAEALNSVASYQLRSRATMGGNLCNASPAADTAPAALTLEAELILHGPNGQRRLAIAEFFKGPGQNALGAGEFLTGIHIPIPPPGAVGRYIKMGRNAHGDLALMGVAVLGYPDGQSASGYRFRIALASVAPTPLRAGPAEVKLAGGPLTAESIEAAAVAAMECARPIDDVRASAAYRKAMVKAMTRRAVTTVWKTMRR